MAPAEDWAARVERVLEPARPDPEEVVGLCEELDTASSEAAWTARNALVGAMWGRLQSYEGDTEGTVLVADVLVRAYRGSASEIYPQAIAIQALIGAGRTLEAMERLNEAQRAFDAATPADRSVYWDYLVLARQRLYKELGLTDLLGLLFPSLREKADELRLELASAPNDEERSRIRARLSGVLTALSSSEVAAKRWASLDGWLGESIRRDEFTAADRPQAMARAGAAAFERDRDDLDGVRRARAWLERVVADEDAEAILRFDAHLRLARIALHRDELGAAAEELEATSTSVELSAYTRAHRSVFSLRLARRTGDGVDAAGDRLLEEWAGLLAEWRRAPLRDGGVGFLTYDNSQRILHEVLTLRSERDGAEAAFGELYAAQAAGTLTKALAAAGRAPAPPVVASDELLLAYAPLLDGAHLFAVTSEGVNHLRLELHGVALTGLVREFTDLVRCSPAADTDRRGRSERLQFLSSRLHDLLLPAPVRDRLARSTRLTINGVDLLHHLSFEVLGNEPETRLGLTHDVALLPSLPFESQQVERADTGSAFELWCGGSDLELPGDWRESLAADYGEAAVHRGASATPAAFARSDAHVLQVFGHGRVNLGDELLIVLDLDQGEIGYLDFARLESPPTLALLTACGSWLGPQRYGDSGSGHLASALLRRGTSAVVLARADVEPIATLALSRASLRARVGGATPARAAREARVMLDRSKRFADPYYHSLLHVVGAGHRALFAPSASEAPAIRAIESEDPAPYWTWILAGTGALVLTAVAARRFRAPSA